MHQDAFQSRVSVLAMAGWLAEDRVWEAPGWVDPAPRQKAFNPEIFKCHSLSCQDAVSAHSDSSPHPQKGKEWAAPAPRSPL